MTCMEVADMSTSEFLRKTIVPVVAAMFLVALLYPLCVENDVCDYLKLWVLMGVSFGVYQMFVWVLPKGFDLGGTVGILVINLLVGGMIMVWRLVMAAVSLNTVSRIEGGQSDMSIEVFRRLAQALGMSASELVGDMEVVSKPDNRKQ